MSTRKSLDNATPVRYSVCSCTIPLGGIIRERECKNGKLREERGRPVRADKQKVGRLLKIARGQIDGILRMVEEDRYCVDISTQLMATQALIARINADVLKAHIEGCVTSAIESGDEDLKAAKLAEIERVVDKLSK